jgi:hypothetical protein
MKPHISNVCRVEITNELAALAAPGATPIPPSMFPPRQVKVIETNLTFAAVMKHHRDAFIPTVSRATAHALVENNNAEYAKQSLLCYTMADYLADNDVKNDTEEFTKAQAAADAGAELVIVAVIGENRSPLSVCRNIVSGTGWARLDGENFLRVGPALLTDAQGAIEAASVFLIEE